MARIRDLKPDFFLDEDIARLTPMARLCFQGLWTLADREGRLEDRPLKIRACLFPYEPRLDVERLIKELAADREHRPGGFIVRYEVNGEQYIQIRNFSKHQKLHPREQPSRIPAPHAIDKDGREKVCLGEPEANLSGTCKPGPSGSVGNSGSSGPSGPSAEQPISRDREVFEYWRLTMEHPDAKFTPKREKAVRGRLREGYTVEQLKLAIDGCRLSPFHQGVNDRQKVFDDLELICRDGEHVEQFLGELRKHKPMPAPTPERDLETDGLLLHAAEHAAKFYAWWRANEQAGETMGMAFCRWPVIDRLPHEHPARVAIIKAVQHLPEVVADRRSHSPPAEASRAAVDMRRPS